MSEIIPSPSLFNDMFLIICFKVRADQKCSDYWTFLIIESFDYRLSTVITEIGFISSFSLTVQFLDTVRVWWFYQSISMLLKDVSKDWWKFEMVITFHSRKIVKKKLFPNSYAPAFKQMSINSLRACDRRIHGILSSWLLHLRWMK